MFDDPAAVNVVLQNGKKAAFALLEECQRLGLATKSGSSSISTSSGSNSSSRLLTCLQEGVQQLVSLGPGLGLEITTSKRR